jgi:hypothetical protein
MRTLIGMLSGVVLMLAFTSTVNAQCRNGVVVRGNTVCTPAPVVVTKPHHDVVATEIITPVAVPVAVPIVVPAFTYQYVPPVGVQPGFGYHSYGGQPTMPGMPQYHGPYQQPAQPQPSFPGAFNSNDKLRELAKLLLEEMRRQDAAANGEDDGPPMAIYPAPTNTGNPQPPLASRPNPRSPLAQPSINALARNCMSCHTGPGSKGDVVIFNQHNVLNPDAPFKSMLSEVEAGRMPPKQSNYKITDEERQYLREWLNGR